MDEEHLVVRAMHAAFDALGERPTGLRLTCINAIPHGRGLGSSAAAIVAGITLANALTEGSGLDGATRSSSPPTSKVIPTTSLRRCSAG